MNIEVLVPAEALDMIASNCRAHWRADYTGPRDRTAPCVAFAHPHGDEDALAGSIAAILGSDVARLLHDLAVTDDMGLGAVTLFPGVTVQ
jgi:hypothetical protein